MWDQVVDFPFRGSAALTLDGKGRLTIPARFRERLTAGGIEVLVVTKAHANRALVLFPPARWEAFAERFDQSANLEADAQRRWFVGSAIDVEIDAAARILVPPTLRDFARLERDVVLLGLGHHFELWDAKLYADHEEQTLHADLPQSLKALSF